MRYPLFKVHIDKNAALNKIEEVLSSGFLNEGAQVQDFLDALRKFHSFNNIVLTNSCTSAITMALKLAGVTTGSEVITTSMTCVASNTPIDNLGATPVWADIDPVTGNIDPNSVEKLITDRTRAVICVNWAGMPCDLESLQRITQKHKIKLIQDAAHSFGAQLNGVDISMFADFTCFSYQAIKHITCGDGGSIFCLNDLDYERAKKMKWFGLDRDKTKDKNGEWKGQRWEEDIDEAGYKFNMNNIAAALGMSQIPHARNIVEKHRRNAYLYEGIFKGHKKIIPLKYAQNADPAFWVYTILLNQCDRDSVLKELNSRGIGAGLVHIPNHNYTCFEDSVKNIQNLNGVDTFHARQISLPCGWWLEPDNISEIASTLLALVK